MAISNVSAQSKMTTELLWKLGRLSSTQITSDGQIFYGVKNEDVEKASSKTQTFTILPNSQKAKTFFQASKSQSIVQILDDNTIIFVKDNQIWSVQPDGKDKKQLTDGKDKYSNIKFSPKGDYIIFSKKVKLKDVYGKDFYPELKKSNVQIYDDLMYRHWDQWADGEFSHVFYASFNLKNGKIGKATDIMKDEPYHCPQLPFGGSEDYIWNKTGDKIIYTCKKKYGKEDAISTNTHLYEYDLKTKTTTVLTEGLNGYNTQSSFSPDGQKLAWCSMAHDGYESDKNDIYIADADGQNKINLTAGWDNSVNNYKWSKDGKTIYFTATIRATKQIFEIKLNQDLSQGDIIVTQLTEGDFDITSIAGQIGDTLIVGRQDMNHASELYEFSLSDKNLSQLTHINTKIYDQIQLSQIDKYWVKTTDGKEELVWVILPPDFDSTKKYPTLLYCQGGPQSPVSQFYSYRWNFQLMAANGYIVVAPNRRGLPGFGTEWNEAISKDWGGQAMKDYLSAIDSISNLPYVDKDRLGCVGASYGGYSTFMLAGIHENRFKTFIAHDGLFDLRSWYGTTEELWFANWDLGGAYWQKDNQAAQNSFSKFSPSDYVDNWNQPILIIQGGMDFRVPIEQGLQAFQAAQLKGIKSKILYFPEENHWILQSQNAVVWQTEFFKWLKETL
ncbi:MAG: S9 family peptidase [Chitinophagales bacterium]|nr:S9 family peptidase [Chitinophagales bacterium]